MTDRSKQPAVLLRRVAQLEAHLEAEKAAHAKTFDVYRKVLHEVVDLKMRNEAAQIELRGEG